MLSLYPYLQHLPDLWMDIQDMILTVLGVPEGQVTLRQIHIPDLEFEELTLTTSCVDTEEDCICQFIATSVRNDGENAVSLSWQREEGSRKSHGRGSWGSSSHFSDTDQRRAEAWTSWCEENIKNL